jgi:hypothetical protein
LNYNDVRIGIIWRCLVGKHQYYFIPIVCDVDFRNIIKMFRVQSGTNMTKLYVCSFFMDLNWTCVLVPPTTARRFSIHSTM